MRQNSSETSKKRDKPFVSEGWVAPSNKTIEMIQVGKRGAAGAS